MISDLKFVIRIRAEEEARKIVEEAKREAEKIVRNAELEAKKKYEKILEERRRKFKIKAEQVLAAEKAKLRIRYSQEKAKLVDDIFQKAENAIYTKITEMTREEKIELLLRLIKEAVKAMGPGQYKVSVNESDMEILGDVLKQASKILDEDVMLDKGETLNVKGGVIVKSADGKRFYDNTIEARIENARAELIGRIYQILYGD